MSNAKSEVNLKAYCQIVSVSISGILYLQVVNFLIGRSIQSRVYWSMGSGMTSAFWEESLAMKLLEVS